MRKERGKPFRRFACFHFVLHYSKFEMLCLPLPFICAVCDAYIGDVLATYIRAMPFVCEGQGQFVRYIGRL